MSFAQVPCPACNVVLRVADSTPANTLLRCPKCGERFRSAVPAENPEEGIVTAELVSASPAPRSPLPEVVDNTAAVLRKIRHAEPRSRAKFWIVLAVLSGGVLFVFLAGVVALSIWLVRSLDPPAPPPPPSRSLVPFAHIEGQDGSAMGWFMKGNLLMSQGDHDGAIDAFTRAIELAPRFTAAYGNRGLARSNKGDLDGAIADSTKAIELNPDDPLPFINRANARIRKGVDPDASIADAKRALELSPGIPAALLNLGMALDLKGDYDGAIAEFDKALALLPAFAKAYGQRGQTRMKMKQWDKAESDFTRALELNFGNPGTYQNRGVCRLEKGNRQGAIADFTAALQLNPQGVVHYYRRSQALLLSGDLKAAQADLDNALVLKPALVSLHSFRAKIFLRQGDGDKALAATERAVALQPKSPDALNCRAFIHAWRGENDKALADYAAALNLNPKYFVVHLLRGWFYLSVGQADKAAEDADAGLKLAGRQHTQSPFLAILAHCARRRQHLDQARRAAEEMIKEGKKNWPNAVLRYLHDDMSAEELLRTAADNDQRTEARGYIGVVLWLSGDANKAHRHLQWVRDNGTPDFIEFDLALLLLRRPEVARAQKP